MAQEFVDSDSVRSPFWDLLMRQALSPKLLSTGSEVPPFSKVLHAPCGLLCDFWLSASSASWESIALLTVRATSSVISQKILITYMLRVAGKGR